MSWVAIWWGVRRALVYLKRMSESQQAQSESLATLARIEQDRWEREFAPRPRGKVVISQLDQAAANEHWRAMHKGEYDIDTD